MRTSTIFMDIVMLVWAVFPFLAWYGLSTTAMQSLFNAFFIDVLHLLLIASFLGFPMSTILYFYWRMQPATKSK